VPWCIDATEMQVVEVLNPLAREFKSIGTLRKELAELQQELEKAHNQVCYHTRISHQETLQYGITEYQYHHTEPNLMLVLHV